MTKCNDACYCRNLIFGITFLTIGAVLLVAGGVIAAVGFGTWPKDMFDQRNLSMRVAGLIMAGSGFLPIIMGIMFIVFYCGYKSGKYPGRKKAPNDIEVSAITGRKAPLNEYPYPSGSSGPIYKPGPTSNDSLMKYEDFGNNDSFTVPLSASGRLSANDGLQSSHVYGEVREMEDGGTVTKTTTTRVYKTTLEDKRNSGSSSGGPNSTEMVHVKPKRPKKPADTSGSGSSELLPFNESDAKLQQKSKRVKKTQKKGSFDEVFDDGEEPLPGGQHRSSGSDTVDGQNWVKKTQHTTTSYEVRTTTSSNPPVYSKVSKKRENRI